MKHEHADALVVGKFTHAAMLETLARGRPEFIKVCAEAMLVDLGEVDVLVNRTGLVMLPYEETVKKDQFHLGEVLVSEAHIRLRAHEAEGYCVVIGRDLEHAMAAAVIDASLAAGKGLPEIEKLVEAESAWLVETDQERLKKVEATRVNMETF